jgi:hypothetical protein
MLHSTVRAEVRAQLFLPVQLAGGLGYIRTQEDTMNSKPCE